MATNKNKKGNTAAKKKKGNILPVLVIAIIGFLAYQANPEYWQQGRLFEDLRNANKKEVKTEEVVQAPEPKKPEKDPDLIYDGSIKGAKTFPAYVLRAVNTYDQNFYVFRGIPKTLYLVYPEGAAADKIVSQLQEGINKREMRKELAVQTLLYTSKDKKTKCESSTTNKFFCEQCDRRICIVNPRKSEFMVVAPSAQSALSKAVALVKSGEWDEKK